MRIGVDFDGVIANTNLLKSQWLFSNYNIMVSPNKTDKTFLNKTLTEYYSKECVLEIQERIRKEIYNWDSLKITPIVEGASDVLKKLSEKHDVIIVTARPDIMLHDVKGWLQANNLGYIKNLLSSTNRTKIEVCVENGIEVLIDDDIRHSFEHDNKVFILFKSDRRMANDFKELNLCKNVADGWKDVESIISCFGEK